MQALVVKTSSLGDVVHTLAAVTDAVHKLPGIRFDWVVEEALVEIPSLHPAVDHVIPVAIRRWRKAPLQALRSGALRQFRESLQAQHYDVIIDAQGLLKSALVARMARGPIYGLDWTSAREPLASLAYAHKLRVPKGVHAVLRLRRSFSQALGYAQPDGAADFGIDRTRLPMFNATDPYLVFLHGTTWASKHWPQHYWMALAQQALNRGFQVYLPWGNAEEQHRAREIAGGGSDIRVLERMNLTQMAGMLAGAAGVVGVDTGLAHLSAALDVPGVFLYGATEPSLTGIVSRRQISLSADFPCAPCLRRECRYRGPASVRPACYAELSPDRVMQALFDLA